MEAAVKAEADEAALAKAKEKEEASTAAITKAKEEAKSATKASILQQAEEIRILKEQVEKEK